MTARVGKHFCCVFISALIYGCTRGAQLAKAPSQLNLAAERAKEIRDFHLTSEVHSRPPHSAQAGVQWDSCSIVTHGKEAQAAPS